MKKELLCIILVLSISSAFAQTTKRKLDQKYDQMRVLTCTVGNLKISKGDTLTIGQPFNNTEQFSFINRRVEWYDLNPELNKLKMSIDWSNRRVIVNNLYSVSDGLNNICYAEFVVSKRLFAWITLDNAMKVKEVVKLNSKDL